jgi:hypothetical protein
MYENDAKKNGFKKVSEMMKSVAIDIKNFVGQGGFLFAMCSATDSYDIALAAQNVDICAEMISLLQIHINQYLRLCKTGCCSYDEKKQNRHD